MMLPRQLQHLWELQLAKFKKQMRYLELDLAKAQAVVEGNDPSGGAKDIAKISKQMDDLKAQKL